MNYEWISVKDKLPESGQLVVAYWSNVWFPRVARYKHDHAKQFMTSDGPSLCVDEVTHWMPLPEPQKQ